MSKSKQLEISNETVRSALCETIEKQLKTRNYTFNLSYASTEGETNFIGIIYRVLVNKKDGIENGNKSAWELILKVAPQNVNRRAMFQAQTIFLQEIYLYEKILPFFVQFEQSKGVTAEENGFSEYPQCYRSVTTDPNECLLLEDLGMRGFRTIDRVTENFTADHVRLVMQSLGKLHAVSFALKDQQPDKFVELASKLSERFIRFDDPYKRVFFNKHVDAIFKLLSGEEDAYLLEKMRKLFKKDAIDIAAECLSTELGSVITHGDVHQNNILFRYDKSGKPCEISLIDWQVSRHCSPIIDIVYFMFCCTTKELRDAHYDKMLKLYHDSLSEHMRRLGSSPDEIFPFSLMQEHFHKFAKFGLIMSTVILPMVTADRGNGIDLDEAADKRNVNIFESFFSDNSRERFHQRLRHVIEDMVRLEYV